MTDYTPEFYEDDDGSEPVLDWLRGLPAYKRRAAVAAIEHILALHGAGVCGTSWGKWVQGVKGSIFELRVRQDYGAVLRDAGVPPPEVSADAAHESHSDILLATAQENAALDKIWGTPHNGTHDRAVPTKQETH